MHRFLISTLLMFVGIETAWAESPRTVAGRSLDQYTLQLSDPDRIVRLRAVRSLGAFGEAAGDALLGGLGHDDPAVRYIAAVQTGRIGGPPLQRAQHVLQELASDESSLAVRLAASFALCRLGEIDQHLPLLTESLGHPARGTACSAAELLGRIGPPAAPAVDALIATIEANRPGSRRGDYHLGGAAMNALRSIRGEK